MLIRSIPSRIGVISLLLVGYFMGFKYPLIHSFMALVFASLISFVAIMVPDEEEID